jgi:6-phosphogluconolactonase
MTVQSFVYESAAAASAACARKVLELLEHALLTQPWATIAVSGGTTPKRMFADMAQAEFNWTNVHLFWVDERSVAPTAEPLRSVLHEIATYDGAGSIWFLDQAAAGTSVRS